MSRGDRTERPGGRRRRGAAGHGGPGIGEAGGPTDPLVQGELFGVDEEQPKAPPTAEERLQHALKLAYRHLAKRDRTVAEVRAHLEKRDVDAASADAAVAELVELEYLDDGRYAQRYVEDRRRLDGWGHLRIANGLRRTGVAAEVAEGALAEDPLRDDEDDLAVEALDRRLAGRAPDGDRGRQKALRMLVTRGFSLDTAYGAVRVYERQCAERDGV